MQKTKTTKRSLITDLRRLAEHDAVKQLKLESIRMAHELYEAGIVVGSATLVDDVFEMELIPVFETVKPAPLVFRCTPVTFAEWKFELDTPKFIRKRRPDLTITNVELRRSYICDEQFWLIFEGHPTFSLTISFHKNKLPRIWLSPSAVRRKSSNRLKVR